MLPVIAIVGRPNVGKSTLFNVLTRSRDALVADVPGLTRDRQYGFGKLGPRPYVVVDTGGLTEETGGIQELAAQQTARAIAEADAVIFVTDARAGLTAAEWAVAAELRKSGKPVHLAVNKAEGLNAELATAEFHTLGLGEPHAIAAAHGEGVSGLIEAVLAPLPPDSDAAASPAGEARVPVAVIGRPNVGKSTLINRLLGEERVIASDQPGTTRDSIFVPFEHAGCAYTLIDTAGLRRRARIGDVVEKFSVVKALQAIERAQVVIAVLDAREGVTEQDAALLGLAVERGRALVIAVNKWDGLDRGQRAEVRRGIALKLPFLDFARLHFISALHGSGLGELMASVAEAQAAAGCELATPELTRVLQAAVTRHPPPLVRGRRPRLRYAHQGGRNPPLIVIHGNLTDAIPDDYRRYLANGFREAFKLYGTPVRVEFRAGDNPYAARQRVRPTPRHSREARRGRRIARKRSP